MINLPRFGFELTSVDYDSSRMLNPMSRMASTQDEHHKYMFNRVPYNFAFSLYLATVKFEDSLKIIEQILPFFTPDISITIKDKEDFDIYTDVPIVLNNSGFSIDYMSGFETRRTIQWSFSFTAKAYLYSNVREQKRIKETIVKMSNADLNKVYETLISEIYPRSANKDETHTVIDTFIDGPPDSKLSLDFFTGESELIDAGQSTPYTPLEIKPITTGSIMTVVPMPTSL